MKNYLNFEADIKTLENELDKLKDPYNQEGLSEVDTNKITKTQEELDEKLKEIYSSLDPWQTTMVARHEDRPKSKFFIDNLFEDFISLAGDRYYGEDQSVLTGFAKFNGQSVLVIGQEKGEDLESIKMTKNPDVSRKYCERVVGGLKNVKPLLISKLSGDTGIECVFTKLTDNDLIGTPIQIIIGKRDLAQGVVEIKDRILDSTEKVHIEEVKKVALEKLKS